VRVPDHVIRTVPDCIEENHLMHMTACFIPCVASMTSSSCSAPLHTLELDALQRSNAQAQSHKLLPRIGNAAYGRVSVNWSHIAPSVRPMSVWITKGAQRMSSQGHVCEHRWAVQER
jgi:hypothetical protein